MNQFYHFAQLVLFKATKTLKSEASRTYLSILWWALEPAFSLTILYLVFALLLESPTKDFAQFLIVGLVVWQWFANTICNCGNSIVEGAPMATQINIHPVFFPTVILVIDLLKFIIVFSLLLLFLWTTGFGISASYGYLFLLIPLNFLFIAACSYLVAALVPLIPDLRIVMTTFLGGLFFVSGIFFAPEQVPAQYQIYLTANPMAQLINGYRAVLIEATAPDSSALLYLLLTSLILLFTALFILSSLRRIYPKIV